MSFGERVKNPKERVKKRAASAPKDHREYGDLLYKAFQPQAYATKVVLQMLVGAAGVAALAGVVCGWSPGFINDVHTTTTVMKHGVTTTTTSHFHVSMAHRCLAVIGTALIITAGIELAYTLYTFGPDEAVEPLILALAAAMILQLANTDHLDEHQAGAIVLYSLALAGLFALRHVVVVKPDTQTATTPDPQLADVDDQVEP